MAMFLVQNNLQPEDVFTQREDLAFPRVGRRAFKGMLGQPYGGFPEELQKIILRGAADHLPARRAARAGRFRGRAERPSSTKKLGHRVNERDAGLLPSCTPASSPSSTATARSTPTPRSSRRRSSSTASSRRRGDRIDIEPGKTLIISSMPSASCSRTAPASLYFELNGEPRAGHGAAIMAARPTTRPAPKADKGNPPTMSARRCRARSSAGQRQGRRRGQGRRYADGRPRR